MTESLQTLGYALLALLVLAAVARGCIERKRQRWMEAIEREQWQRWAESAKTAQQRQWDELYNVEELQRTHSRWP